MPSRSREIIGSIMPLYAASLGATYAIILLLNSAWSISQLVFTIPVDVSQTLGLKGDNLSEYSSIRNSVSLISACEFKSPDNPAAYHVTGKEMGG